MEEKTFFDTGNVRVTNSRFSFKDKGIESGVEHPEGSDRWMFSKFVELFC